MYNVQNDENNIIKATETLKNFLCSEGILPTRIIRLLRQETETQYTANVMADILLSRENFDPNAYENPKQYENITSILKEKPFDNDPELISWLQKASIILNILKTKEIYPGIETPEEIKLICIENLIKSCTLSTEAIKTSYLNQIPQQKTYIQPTRERSLDNDMKRRFRDFLSDEKNGKRSMNTVNVYLSSLNYINTKYIKNMYPTYDIPENDLWDITDKNKIYTLQKILDQNKDYKKDDSDRHNALSTALIHYKKFLESKF